MDTIGKYEILEKIGVGGFGVVYKARDPFIKRVVAVKTCSSDHEEIRQRFHREAEIAGNLQHRNVTTVYDFGVEGEVPYLVQEFLTGEDLEEFIRTGQPLPDSTRVDFLVQIAEGLEYAHGKGVVHRDIKPGNIRILESGRVKIMDFGIAKLTHATSRLTRTGMTLGTSAYLAPEQIQDEEVTRAVDVYAFGVVAYELLTGRRPFRGKSVSALFYQILNQDPVPVGELWDRCPPELVEIVERCLEKDPRDRYGSFSELLEELRPLRDRLAESPEAVPDPFGRDAIPDEEAPTTAMPSASVPGGPGSPPRSRSRDVLSMTAGIVLVASLVLASLYLSSNRSPDSLDRVEESTEAETPGVEEAPGPALAPVGSAGGQEEESGGDPPSEEALSGNAGEVRPGSDTGQEPPRREEGHGSIVNGEGAGAGPAAEREIPPATAPARAEGREPPGRRAPGEGTSGRSGASAGEDPGGGPDLAAIDDLLRQASVATEVESRRARAAEEARSSAPIRPGGTSRRPGRSRGSSGSEGTAAGPSFADVRDSRNEIAEVVKRYAAAYEALDAQAVREVFPSAPRGLTLTFAGYRSLDLSLTDCTIERDADRARARCRSSQVVELEAGGSRREEGTVELVLERRDRRWLIVERILSR